MQRVDPVHSCGADDVEPGSVEDQHNDAGDEGDEGGEWLCSFEEMRVSGWSRDDDFG